MPTCDILLAAYNGMQHGPALLDSLLAQTHTDFRLIVRDDGSKDGTPEMLRQYAPRFGGRMQILEAGQPTGSAPGNFSILLQHTDADHILFADIDDVWHPGKVAHTLKLMTDAAVPSETPLYAFTDVTPVDATLNPIMDSFWQFKRIDPKISQHLNRSLICPPMLGCASGIVCCGSGRTGCPLWRMPRSGWPSGAGRGLIDRSGIGHFARRHHGRQAALPQRLMS